jgi:hypothetical protein
MHSLLESQPWHPLEKLNTISPFIFGLNMDMLFNSANRTLQLILSLLYAGLLLWLLLCLLVQLVLCCVSDLDLAAPNMASLLTC